jgi:nucleotide-binding universal stress UspA family protein
MFRTVLVPLDGSRFAEAALPMASRLTRATHGRLHLVLAHQPTAAVAGVGEFAIAEPAIDRALEAREAGYLGDLVLRLNSRELDPVESSHTEGAAGEAVVTIAQRIGADLVVMATHGRSTLGRLWLGSVSNHVVRHVGIPVLLLRPNLIERSFPTGPGAGILVALDLSSFSEAVLEPVVTMANLLQAHVTLFHVIEPNYLPMVPALPYPLEEDATLTETRRADAVRRLDGVADRLRARGVHASVRVILAPSAAGAVLQALEDHRYDMAAMTTHGGGGMRRLFLGSVADKVIRSAVKPVLVMRPAPLPEE